MHPKRMSFAVSLALTIGIGGIGLLLLAMWAPWTVYPAPRASASGQVATLPAPPESEQVGIKVLADDPSPPASPVKLIFIHHSTGGNWLADLEELDQSGGLGRALMENNYFVSATNYGWGPGEIGSRTDIPNWPEWFTDTVMSQVYTEYDQNICGLGSHSESCFGNWPRLSTDPGGENEIIMFKSCFPNSDLYGNPDDPPYSEPNDWEYSVSNAKAVYNEILTYFEAHQDKLFVVITAPPMAEGEYAVNDPGTPAAERAANTRAFNDWLLNEWLADYSHNNVAVFDYYNVLTSNGSATRIDDTSVITEPNDYDLRPDGNHHYWNGSQVLHTQTVSNNFSAYPSYSGGPDWYDSHPMTNGQSKATQEFVPLLNVFYNRWQGGTTCVGVTDVAITGPATGYTDTLYTFAATVTPANASTLITYTWEPGPDSGQGSASTGYTWATTGTKTLTLTAENCGGSDTATHTVSIQASGNYRVYLPQVVQNYGTAAPACPNPLTGVTISGPTSGYTDTLYTFTATPAPANATPPIAYTWSPAPESGQDTASASYQWATTGSKSIGVTAGNCTGAHTADDDHLVTIQAAPSGDLVQPADLTYLGAFRLPGGDTPPQTFAYGGNAMTFNPDGDPDNSDAYPGSLFVTGHDRQAWGTLPDGDQVAEVSIPVPAVESNPADLPQAAFLQDFYDVTAGYFTNLEEIPKVGMQYLDHPDTGPLLHLCWGQHLQPPDEPSHAWFSPNLTAPNLQGVWFIGHQSLYSTNGYMFDIPATWADAHAQGRYLATGRMRDGGQGGMGPTLFAYRPWLEGGTAPVSGTHLSETTLLLYENVNNTPEITRCLDGYQHPDEWEGGAWITTPSGKSAVLFAGTKSQGTKYWYGYVHPDGPQHPCVDTEVTDFLTCRLADGSSCPPEDFAGCCDENAGTCVSYRGWWSTRFDAQLILYDPADLARVAAGERESWEPQPYAVLDIDEHLYLDPPEWDEINLGWGDQRRYRIGAVAYDRESGLLYVLEQSADDAKPVVHVWQVE